MQYDAIAFLEALFAPSDQMPAEERADLPPEWFVVWDERAAIMEFDGGLPRERAEHLALLDVMAQMRQVGTLPRGGDNRD